MKRSFFLGFITAVALYLLAPVVFKKTGVNPSYLGPFIKRSPISSKWLGPAKEPITFAELQKEEEGIEQLPVYGGSQLCFEPHPFFKNSEDLFIDYEPAYIARLPGARVYGRNGVVISRGDRVLEESARMQFSYPCFFNEIDLVFKLPKRKVMKDRVAVLSAPGSACYYHWMTEVLPMLHLLQKSGVAVDKYYVMQTPLRYQHETLQTMKLPADKIFWASDNTQVEAQELLFPFVGNMAKAFRGHERYHYRTPPWAYHFLRQTFLPKVLEKPHRRLYVSRNKASFRRLVNEQELLGILEDLGFENVFLEDYTVAEQAKLFSEASCVVAPHGAGLTNIVFCQEGTKVIELFAPRWLHDMFLVIGKMGGLKHEFLIGHEEGLSSDQKQRHDFIIDKQAFSTLLNQLL